MPDKVLLRGELPVVLDWSRKDSFATPLASPPGDTSSQRYLKPAWLDACSGALAAAQACCTKLTDDAAGASSCDIIKQQHGQAAVSMADVIKGSLPFLRVAMEAEANRLLLITREVRLCCNGAFSAICL